MFSSSLSSIRDALFGENYKLAPQRLALAGIVACVVACVLCSIAASGEQHLAGDESWKSADYYVNWWDGRGWSMVGAKSLRFDTFTDTGALYIAAATNAAVLGVGVLLPYYLKKAGLVSVGAEDGTSNKKLFAKMALVTATLVLLSACAILAVKAQNEIKFGAHSEWTMIGTDRRGKIYADPYGLVKSSAYEAYYYSSIGAGTLGALLALALPFVIADRKEAKMLGIVSLQ